MKKSKSNKSRFPTWKQRQKTIEKQRLELLIQAGLNKELDRKNKELQLKLDLADAEKQEIKKKGLKL